MHDTLKPSNIRDYINNVLNFSFPGRATLIKNKYRYLFLNNVVLDSPHNVAEPSYFQ